MFPACSIHCMWRSCLYNRSIIEKMDVWTFSKGIQLILVSVDFMAQLCLDCTLIKDILSTLKSLNTFACNENIRY